jgi:hypothetical protein
MGWREGARIAEAAAWAEHGKRNSTFYIMRPLIGPALLVLGLGAAGYGAYRGFGWLTSQHAAGHVPSPLLWILGSALVAVTLAAARSGRARPLSVILLLALVLGALWLLWLGAVFSSVF